MGEIVSKFKKMREKSFEDLPFYKYNDSEIILLPLFGKNIYWDPWHLHMDLAKEFKSFISRGELVGLIREINHTLKWSNSAKFNFNLLCYFFPFLENRLVLTFRRSAFKKFERYLEQKNIQLAADQGETLIYSLSVWHSDNFERGQVVIISEQKDESGPKPF
jgi:hypothetical protein